MADNSTSWSNVQTVCCEDTSVLGQCTFDYCPEGRDDELFEYVTGQLWRVGAMMLINAILAGIMVGIGAYDHRYRHYGFTRYLLLGATTLFLPIISYVLSTNGSTGGLFSVPLSPIISNCGSNFFHTYMVIVSTCVVLISAINTSPIVATDDKEDRSIRPPLELLLQGIWIVYLVVNTHVIPVGETTPLNYLRISTPFALIHAKMALKCYAFIKALKSFALLSPVVPKWLGCLLQCRCNRLMRHWNDKMRQNSLLVLRPRQFDFPRYLPHLLLNRERSNNVKVPMAVQICIINTLRSTIRSNGVGLSKGTTSLGQSQAGRSLLWACNNNKGTSDTILVWHIATTILEARGPHHQHDDTPQKTLQGGRPSSIVEKKTAATHLSCYSAYLVASCPELLPDDDTWSKHLYKKVKKDADQALATHSDGIAVSSLSPEAGYLRLIQYLGAT
uniref:DUF4220 domain-containing protein n=1 Tax=Aegilops tauschii TaxID=37682 RepID=M8AQY9_AEGTA